MSLAYIFAATKAEARALRRVPPAAGAVQCSTPARIFVTGMGPAAARAAARRAVESIPAAGPRPTLFLVMGVCGSLTKSLAENTIVIYSACLTTAGNETAKTSSTLAGRMAAALEAKCGPIESVVGVTTHKMAALRSEKLHLAERGASVVDMESYEILAAARAAGIPGAALRVVSDSLERELPDFTPAIGPGGEIRRVAAALIALRAPVSTARLMAAQRRAIKRLEAALEVALGSFAGL
ncbi:MAG: hypothetical protein ACRD1I_03200 [Terriglobia bacterium]